MNQFNLKSKRTFQAQERQTLGFERHRGAQLHKEQQTITITFIKNKKKYQ